MKAPFGWTWTGVPLISSEARPLPTEPKMKFESLDPMVAPGAG
jgi:hypothetical protein